MKKKYAKLNHEIFFTKLTKKKKKKKKKEKKIIELHGTFILKKLHHTQKKITSKIKLLH